MTNKERAIQTILQAERYLNKATDKLAAAKLRYGKAVERKAMASLWKDKDGRYITQAEIDEAVLQQAKPPTS